MYLSQRELSDFEARGRIEKFSAIFSLIVLGLTIFFLGLSTYGLFDVDETRYAAAALEMVSSGDYLIPTFNGEPRHNIPILFYWFLAGFVHVLGNSPYSFRLISAVFAFAIVMAVGHIVYRESRVEGGFLAGVILATSFFFAYMGRVAVVDMVFSVLIFVSSICLYYGTYDSKKIDRFMIRMGTLTMALAFITKGYTGVLLPLLCLFLFSWLNGRLKRMVDAILDLRAVLLFLLIALPWFVAVYLRLGPGYFYQYFIKANIDKFLNITTVHRGPIFYYIPVIILGLFPWSFFLPQTVFSILKERGFSLKTVGENISLDMFLLFYSAVIFVFFSLSATKLAPFMLSIFPALAIIIALYLEKVITNRKYPDLGLSAGAYAYAFFSFLIGMLMIYPREYFPIISEADLQEILYYPAILLFIGGIFAMFFAIFRKTIKRVRIKIFASMLIPQIIFLWFTFFAVLPSIYEYRQNDLRVISRFINKNADENSSVIFYRKFKPSVVMLTGKKVLRAMNFEDVVAYTTDKKRAFVIAPGTTPLGELASIGGLSEMYRGKLYSLHEIDVK